MSRYVSSPEVAMARTERNEWVRRFERWQRSGLELRAFASQERLSLQRLAWWRWRLTRDGDFPSAAAAPATALVPLAQPVSFVELASEPDPHAAPIEVVLGNGRIVRVPAWFDDGALSRVLAVADGVA